MSNPRLFVLKEPVTIRERFKADGSSEFYVDVKEFEHDPDCREGCHINAHTPVWLTEEQVQPKQVKEEK